jgi:hypothetical protein
MLVAQCERKIITHLQKRSKLYFSIPQFFYIFGKQIERQKIPDRMVTGVPSTQSTPNLFMRTATNTVG